MIVGTVERPTKMVLVSLFCYLGLVFLSMRSGVHSTHLFWFELLCSSMTSTVTHRSDQILSVSTDGNLLRESVCVCVFVSHLKQFSSQMLFHTLQAEEPLYPVNRSGFSRRSTYSESGEVSSVHMYKHIPLVSKFMMYNMKNRTNILFWSHEVIIFSRKVIRRFYMLGGVMSNVAASCSDICCSSK